MKLVILIAAAALTATAHAQADFANQDPPNRVARVAILQGNVSLEPAGVDQFSAAELNYPLTAGDRLYTDNGALSELQTAGLAVRLANGADLSVTSLTDSVAQFGLTQGSIRLRTRDLFTSDGQQGIVEIDTPNGAILVQQPGDIRVDSYPQDDTTVVTISSGLVEITADGVDLQLGQNQSLRLAGNPVYTEPLRLLPPDALDQFDAEREQYRRQSFAASAQYADPEMIGAADLGQYGDWDPNAAGILNSDQYGGAVWFPRAVPADWTPYHNGHWAWVAPWGWTWVEAEPWGFAPFHYGRWANYGGRWGWIPGPPPGAFGGGDYQNRRPIRPVYSPALVAFVGGPNFSISVGFGGVSGTGVTAWFPLGPHEAYQPWYHASPGYVNRVNVTNIYNRNVTEVHNTYINRTTNIYNVSNINYVNRPQATTAVSQHDFAAGQRISQSNAIRFDSNQRRQLDQAPILPHPLVTPAVAIARPQAPARVVPPSTERPIFERAGPSGPNRPNGPNGSQLQAPFRSGPVLPRVGIRPEQGGGVATPNPQQPDGRLPEQQRPVQQRPVQERPVQEQPVPQQRPITTAIPTQTQPARQPMPGADGATSNIYNPHSTSEGSQPQRGAFPQQRDHQAATPAPVAAPVAQPVRPTAPTQPQQQPPLAGRPGIAQPDGPIPRQTLTARPLPRPVTTDAQPRPLVVATPPQQPQPSFEQQQRAIQRNDPGRPLGPGQVENLRNGRPAGPAQQPEAAGHPTPAAAPAATLPGRRPNPQNRPDQTPDSHQPKPQ